MKKYLYFIITLLFLTACNHNPSPFEPLNIKVQPSNNIKKEIIEPTYQNSYLYLEDVDINDVYTYFNEVCLDSEYSDGGNPNLIQKWTSPIKYMLHGDYTQKDLEVLESFCNQLNAIPNFPGISQCDQIYEANLNIHFGDSQQMQDILGSQYYNLDGGVTFWYNGDNEIYQATICILTTIDQHTRNSVIIEEIYNGLGPIQDTILREDSIIYQYYSTPQQLTTVDELILKLLYHPDIKCGMNQQECENIIEAIYK